MKNVAFIINPNSSDKNYQPFLTSLKKEIEDVNLYISTSLEGTRSFIQENFNTTDIFVAVGGDGTISSVAKSLINTEKILAIFPAGSGNGFSNETNFNKNITDLIAKIQAGKFREIDTFKVNDHLSINVSGSGFDGKVVKQFEKTSRGFKNYIKISLKTYFSFKPVEINFKAEKFKKFGGKFLMVNFANTRQFGNNAYIAPHASTVDGLVEVVLVKKFPVYYAPLFAYQMFTKNLKASDYITFLSVPEIEFDISTEDWHVDGEYMQIKSPVEIKVLPKSLRILI